MPVRRRVTRTASDVEADRLEEQMAKKIPMSELDTIRVAMPDHNVLMLGFGEGENGVTPHPKDVPTEVLLRQLRICDEGDNLEKHYRNRIRSPLTAIRAFCVLCSVGKIAANKCGCVSCPLWVFRKGQNPFYGKHAETDDGLEENASVE